jgi:O-succinylbenzoate synthase
MEIDKLEFHHYVLTPRSAPNRLSTSVPRPGCLLRVYFKGLKHPGHADLFPWPELGDEPLSLQIDALKEGTPCSLGAASLAWAHYEAKAVEQNKTLLSDKTYPSHLTLTELTEVPMNTSLIKIKISSIDSKSWAPIETFIQKYPQTKFRLDFNGLIQSISDAKEFWQRVSAATKKQIDFLEDPYTPELMGDENAMEVFEGTKTAVDRIPTAESMALANYWVVKPVYFSPDHLFSEADQFFGKIAVTSNMDHPLGQLIALHAAQKISKHLIPGGLLTHDLYLDHDAKRLLKTEGINLLPTYQGPGWGCRDYLRTLPWSI